MKPWERRFFNLAVLCVTISGGAYGWMKYFVSSDDPFSLVNHPWQNAMLGLHVVGAPLLVLAFGIVLNSHVMKKLRATGLPNRRTGYTSLVMFAVMVFSGYLLQVSADDRWLQALVYAHVGSSALFTAAYGIHLVISWRIGRRATSPARFAHVA